jgi:cytoskeletal protein CcmA (bactofilin family)
MAAGSDAGGGTLLGPGTAFEGLLTFRGGARVDGELAGEVKAEGTLVLGPTARVRAKVEVDELILAGHLEGEVTARRRVAIEPGARLVGSITAPLLRIEDGAFVEGPCRSGTRPTTDAAKAPETTGNTPESA